MLRGEVPIPEDGAQDMTAVAHATLGDDAIESRWLRVHRRIALVKLFSGDVEYSVSRVRTFLRKAGALMPSRTYDAGRGDSRTASPSMFERSGQHAMRETAVGWCRAHPVEAAELPGWDVNVLRKVLEGVA